MPGGFGTLEEFCEILTLEPIRACIEAVQECSTSRASTITSRAFSSIMAYRGSWVDQGEDIRELILTAGDAGELMIVKMQEWKTGGNQKMDHPGCAL